MQTLTLEDYKKNIGSKVHKHMSGKPFKSGLVVNTIKGVINHPHLNIPAYTFIEDESYVECRRCEPISNGVVKKTSLFEKLIIFVKNLFNKKTS
jgi:hypothetical protein